MADQQGLDSLALAKKVAELAAEKKAEDIVILDMTEAVSYTDYFVICSGNNERQVKAIHDAVYEGLKHGADHLAPNRVEGLQQSSWVLLDYLDVVVHIFMPETRDFYRLDRLWGDVPEVKVENQQGAV